MSVNAGTSPHRLIIALELLHTRQKTSLVGNWLAVYAENNDLSSPRTKDLFAEPRIKLANRLS